MGNDQDFGAVARDKAINSQSSRDRIYYCRYKYCECIVILFSFYLNFFFVYAPAGIPHQNSLSIQKLSAHFVREEHKKEWQEKVRNATSIILTLM